MFLLHKDNLIRDHLVYKWYDEETGFYLMDRSRWKVVYEDEPWDYFSSDADLLCHIAIAMDDDTDIYVVPASEVEGSPEKYWYFIY